LPEILVYTSLSMVVWPSYCKYTTEYFAYASYTLHHYSPARHSFHTTALRFRTLSFPLPLYFSLVRLTYVRLMDVYAQ